MTHKRGVRKLWFTKWFLMTFCSVCKILGSLSKQSHKTVADDLWVYFILGTPSPEIHLGFKLGEDPQEQMSTNKTMPVLSEGAVLQVCSILINTYLLEIGNAVSKRGKSLRINYLCLLFCLFFLLLVSFFSFLSHSVSLLQL